VPIETSFKEHFLKCLPRLLTDPGFRDEVLDRLGEEGPEILKRVRKKLPLDEGGEDDLFDVASEAYSNCAKEVLTLG
jgi:hypothetical protein